MIAARPDENPANRDVRLSCGRLWPIVCGLFVARLACQGPIPPSGSALRSKETPAAELAIRSGCRNFCDSRVGNSARTLAPGDQSQGFGGIFRHGSSQSMSSNSRRQNLTPGTTQNAIRTQPHGAKKGKGSRSSGVILLLDARVSASENHHSTSQAQLKHPPRSPLTTFLFISPKMPRHPNHQPSRCNQPTNPATSSGQLPKIMALRGIWPLSGASSLTFCFASSTSAMYTYPTTLLSRMCS